MLHVLRGLLICAAFALLALAAELGRNDICRVAEMTFVISPAAFSSPACGVARAGPATSPQALTRISYRYPPPFILCPPPRIADLRCPVTFIYGVTDWMDWRAGKRACEARCCACLLCCCVVLCYRVVLCWGLWGFGGDVCAGCFRVWGRVFKVCTRGIQKRE